SPGRGSQGREHSADCCRRRAKSSSGAQLPVSAADTLDQARRSLEVAGEELLTRARGEMERQSAVAQAWRTALGAEAEARKAAGRQLSEALEERLEAAEGQLAAEVSATASSSAAALAALVE
ncbi:unnamed protein product, partial [Polarella glacialis]